jgi:hypothetical protein
MDDTSFKGYLLFFEKRMKLLQIFTRITIYTIKVVVMLVVGVMTVALLVAGVVTGTVVLAVKKRPKLEKENIPECLGILDEVPTGGMLEKLDLALDADYLEQVKYRFMQEHPKVTEDEYEWRLFELKRYFFLTGILKETPMFSEKVDEVWHTMLMFTQKYQRFSEGYLGSMLHHKPNINPTPAPQERAFFDWVFSQLFSVTQYSWTSWGSFFRHPVVRKVLQEFKEESDEWLRQKYFKVSEENKETVNYLISRMRQQVRDTEKMYQLDQKGSFTRQRTYGEMTNVALAMVFFSSFYFDDYWEHARAYAFAREANHTSGCSGAVFCGTGSSGSDNGHGGGHDGHSCGGHDGGSSCSSCSSCGSGCSS